MIAFILRRLAHMIPLLLAISIISFVVINLPPGDYLTVKILELESRGTRAPGASLSNGKSVTVSTSRCTCSTGCGSATLSKAILDAHLSMKGPSPISSASDSS